VKSYCGKAATVPQTMATCVLCEQVLGPTGRHGLNY